MNNEKNVFLGGDGFGNYRTKWCAHDINTISLFLLQCKMPKEIHRAVRGLDCLAFWKGLEYRTFIHYIGIEILKQFLPIDAYQHFLLIFCAITICSSNMYKDALELAHTLLCNYIEYFADIYEEDHISSNVHNLCHIVEDVKRFGILTTFNAYLFENKLLKIKNLLRSGRRPLAQVAKRLSEMNPVTRKLIETNKFPLLKKVIFENILTYQEMCKDLINFDDNIYTIFSHIKFEDYTINTTLANKWFLSKSNDIVCFQLAIKIDTKFFGRRNYKKT